tara:strand:+ start:234 stop:488 length:255 start_codon:yes stop_codon:yes gene_type:complete
VKQKFPGSFRIVIETITPRTVTDVYAVKKGLPAIQSCIALAETGLALAQGLHLRPKERDPRLEGVDDLVVMPCTAILGNQFCAA